MGSRFHCLLPVRDEADIIGQCLEHLTAWADGIYVFDTGSSDHTWEIVQDFAAREKRVIPLRKDPVYFNDTVVRGWIFDQVRRHMRPGDWFLRVDADEFHHIPPPNFVSEHLRPFETVVYHQYYNFVLTDSEVRDWEQKIETLEDRSRPIEQRRQRYQISHYTEPRLCRYRETMRWPPHVSFPFNAGYVAKMRLPIRHYPHRDPDQLRRRCLLRAKMMTHLENRANWTHPDLHHWMEHEWRKFVITDSTNALPRWLPGTPLPLVCQFDHLSAKPKRMIQRLVHACLLPCLDRFRPEWPEDAYPVKIPSNSL